MEIRHFSASIVSLYLRKDACYCSEKTIVSVVVDVPDRVGAYTTIAFKLPVVNI